MPGSDHEKVQLLTRTIQMFAGANVHLPHLPGEQKLGEQQTTKQLIIRQRSTGEPNLLLQPMSTLPCQRLDGSLADYYFEHHSC